MKKTACRVRDSILYLLDRIHLPFQRFIPAETFRYGATGGFNTLLDIALYFIFYHYVLAKNMVELSFVTISPHIAAFIFVFPITFTTGFLFARHITFTSSPIRGRVQFARYAITVTGAIMLNYILLKVLVEQFLIWPTVSKIITTIIVVAYSYLAQRYFTFKTGKIPVVVKKNQNRNEI